MRIFFVLNHPSQYHLFKNLARSFSKREIDIYFIIKQKDILEELLISDGCDYTKIQTNSKKRRKNSFSILFNSGYAFLLKEFELFKLAKKYNPNFMLGTDASITHIGRLLKIPSFVFNEDDISVTPLFCYLSYPFASRIISPAPCHVGRWEYKKIGYCGYQKLAYLHPNVFKPNKEVVKTFNPNMKRYFIIRVVQFTATHDLGANGLNLNIARKVIKILKPYGRVYVTSEGNLAPDFRQYYLDINPSQFHHVLYFADLLISDSQSVSVEAAVLGTPSLRFNDFVGKISILEELEHHYGLTFGISPSQPEKLFSKIREILSMTDLKSEWQKRRKKMLLDKIDVTAFMAWFIENYPESVKIMNENPEFQLGFK